MSDNKSSLIKLISAMAIFGTIGIFVKYISLPSSLIALFRALIGMSFLTIIMRWKGLTFSFQSIRKNIIPLLFSGFFLGFNWIFLFESYRYTTVAVSTLCYYLAPILVVILSPLFLKERLNAIKICCVLAAICGMFFISGVIPFRNSVGDKWTGVLLGLSAAALYAAIIILNQKLQGIGSFERTVFQLGVSVIVLIPYCLFTCDWSLVRFDGTGLLLLLIIGVIHTGLSYYLYFGSMEHLSAQTVAMIGYLDPVIAVLISLLILKEPLKLLDIPGALLILGAAVVSELPIGKGREQ